MEITIPHIQVNISLIQCIVMGYKATHMHLFMKKYFKGFAEILKFVVSRNYLKWLLVLDTGIYWYGPPYILSVITVINCPPPNEVRGGH